MSGDDDDATYRRNVTTMVIVLAAIVLTVFAAIFIPPLINPVKEQFPQSVSLNSPYGFSLNLHMNSTQVPQGGRVAFEVWLNNTSNQILNATAIDSWLTGWPVASFCQTFPPVAVGALPGYYTSDNVTLSQVHPFSPPAPSQCPTVGGGLPPKYYLFKALKSQVLVATANSTVAYQTNLDFTYVSGQYFVSGKAAPFSGIVTVVAADEWGDIVVGHLTVSAG